MNAAAMRARFDEAEPFPVMAANEKPTVSATPYVWRDPASIPARDWVYGHQLLRGTVSVIVAPGATGKTALTIGTALALASGRALLGKAVWPGPCAVWLWNLEDDRTELSRGIQAAAQHWGIGADALVTISPDNTVWPLLYVDSAMDGAELKIAHDTVDGTRINAPVVEDLVTELSAKAIDVLIVDPFVSSHGVSENDNNAIDMVAKQWARVAKRANCSIVLVHHARKLGGTEVNAESARGASALIAAARSVVTLNRMSEDEAAKFGIEDETRRRYFRVYDDKNNRAPPADKSDWYHLASVSLGNGEDGGDNMPVVVPWTPPDTFDGVSVSHLRAVQEKIAQGDYRKDQQSKPWAGDVVIDVLGLDAGRKGDRLRALSILKTWENNGALTIETIKNADTNYRPRPVYRVGEWATVE